MEHVLTYLTDKYHGCMKYWRLPIVLGIIIFILGLAILAYLKFSYMTMALLFGIMITISGIVYIVMSASKTVKGRGWLMASGIIELMLGILLMILPTLSILSLPYFLAFWLIFKGFTLIGIGSDMSDIKGSGWGWTILTAILLIICAFIILVQPIGFGIEAVVLWVGISLIIGGISIFGLGIQIRNTRKFLRKQSE